MIFNHLYGLINVLEIKNEILESYLKNLLNCCTLTSEYVFVKELNNRSLLTYPIDKLVKADTIIVKSKKKIVQKQRQIFAELIDLNDWFHNVFNKTNILCDIVTYIDQTLKIKSSISSKVRLGCRKWQKSIVTRKHYYCPFLYILTSSNQTIH